MSLLISSNAFLVYNLPKVKNLLRLVNLRRARKVFATIGQSFSHFVCEFDARQALRTKLQIWAIFKCFVMRDLVLGDAGVSSVSVFVVVAD